MKKAIARILLAVTAITAPLAARADLILYDGFQYPNGAIITNTIIGPSTNSLWWRESGTATPSDMITVNSNLQVFASSGSVVNRQDDCDRLFSQTNNCVYTNSPQLVYASFTVICTNLPNGPGSYFASFYSGPVFIWNANGFLTNNSSPGFTNFAGFGYCGRVQAFTNGTILPNTWRLGVTDNGAAANLANGGFPVDLATNVPYQVVEELDPITLQACSIWVNPINIYNTGTSTTDPVYTANDAMGFALTTQVNSYAFRQASSFGNASFLITNLAVASTYAEAATNVWATNAVAPIIAYQPVGVHNFPGSSFILSVVADGQGLGSLTYQWQENSNNISNPNGNSNILPFNSVAATSGTNYYDVVVTTPYGLSVTSSVATVGIDTTPQSPIFLSQPVNQVLYAGQNAVFTTTVASPGNVTFTWYSNNIPITTGVSSTAYTSTLEEDNITAANAAKFYVAVTNDVFPIGVVSTTNTLTVKVPSTVTIGYLRTLVSTSTFLPTNTPPTIAYQVTGTVTTYTNITSGNTSSYFLQDASGGINIFVTGGSSFRPALGDSVTFVGVLSSFTSGLELYADTADTSFPFTSFTDNGPSAGGVPAPKAIGYNFLTNNIFANTNLGGSLVQISDVYFGARGGTTTSTSANDTVAITNSAGKIFYLLFPDLDLDVAGQTLPNYAYSVSGILYSANTFVTNLIVVTRFADINTNSTFADVGVVDTGAASVAPGGNVTYTVSVSNAGPAPATNTVVTNSLPFGSTFVSANLGGVLSGGVITWTLGTVASGATSNLTLTVTAPSSGAITNLAGATSDTPQFNPAANIGAKVITVVTLTADLSVVETAPTFVFAGSNLSYSISVSNAGPSQASSVVVTDSLPTSVTFVSATGGGVNNSGVVNWSVGALASNATASVSVTVRAPVSGIITNKASVSSVTADSSSANNTSALVITKVAPIPVAGPITVSGGTATISWNVASGPTYSILWSTNVLGPYTAVASGLTSSPYIDTANTNQVTSFYKITSP